MRTAVRIPVLAALFVAALAAAPAARATGLPLDRFEPAPAGDRLFDVPSPAIGGHLAASGAMIFDYAHAPLVFRSGTSSSAVLSDQLLLHADATLSLWNRVAVNIDMPFATLQSGSSPTVGGEAFSSPQSGHVGDLRAGLRVRLLGQKDSPLQLSLGGYAWFPTAGSSSYLGSGEVRGMPQLLLGGRSDRLVWSFLAGPKFQGSQVYAGVSQGTELDVGAGLAVLLLRDRSLQLGAEAYSAFTLVHAAGATKDSLKTASNVEVLADVRYRVVPSVEFGMGFGPGLTTGLGTPSFRGVFTATYRFDPTPAAPAGQLARVESGADRM
jgi:hypothetical protein